MRCPSDTGRVMYRHADQIVVGFLLDLPEVHSHADPHTKTVGPFVGLDGTLSLDCGGETSGWRVEAEEERVALGAMLDTADALESGAHDLPMISEQRAILGPARSRSDVEPSMSENSRVRIDNAMSLRVGDTGGGSRLGLLNCGWVPRNGFRRMGTLQSTIGRQRAVGCVLGSAVGDALGAPFEFRQPGEYSSRFPRPVHGGIGMRHGRSLADAQALLAERWPDAYFINSAFADELQRRGQA